MSGQIGSTTDYGYATSPYSGASSLGVYTGALGGLGGTMAYSGTNLPSGFGIAAGTGTGFAMGGPIGGVLGFMGSALATAASKVPEISQTAIDIAQTVGAWKSLEVNKDSIVASNVGAAQAQPQPVVLTTPASGGAGTTLLTGGAGGIDATTLIVIGAVILLVILLGGRK